MRRQCQLQAHLGRNLQAVYQDVVKEPVPGRLIRLLDGLKRKEKEKGSDALSLSLALRHLRVDALERVDDPRPRGQASPGLHGQ
jgi:hypothetical protein